MSNFNRTRLSLAIVLGVLLFAKSNFAQPAKGPKDFDANPAQSKNKRFLQDQWFLKQRTYPLDRIPDKAKLKAFNQTKAHVAAQSATQARTPTRSPGGQTWINIGPAPILGGQTVPPQPVSGRVEAIAVDPQSTNHWFIGAAQGGIWETKNAGAVWTPITDDQASLAMGAIAIAPSDPNTIYAGTGEAAFSGDAYAGAGLLKSTNAGVSWLLLATDTFGKVCFSDIKVHPTDPNTLLAATASGIAGRGVDRPPSPPARGIFKSIDGGITWSQKLNGQATDLEVDPTSFQNQYCALGNPGGSPANGAYRSTNGGDNWALISGPWTGNTAVGRIELAIAPSQPATLYVSIQDVFSSSSLGTWRTDNAWDATPTWTQLPNIPSPGSQFWYDFDLLVDQTNPNILYLAEIAVWKYDGSAWTPIGGNYDPNSQGINFHPDQHVLAWAGSRLIIGNDGGVWSTTDGGSTFNNHNTTLAITQFYDGSLHPTDGNFALAGAQDNGSERWVGANAWQLTWYGDGCDNAISTSRPNTDWALSSQFLSIVRTRDGGVTVDQGDIGIDKSGVPFIARFEKSPANDDVFIAGTDRLWRCNNFFSGSSPSWVVNGPVMSASITAVMFAASDVNSTTYAYGTDAGELQITKDGGANWTDLNSANAVPSRTVTGLAFDPTNPNVLYVSLSGFDEGTPNQPGHLFRTTNALAAIPQWFDVSPPVDIPNNTVVVDPGNSATVYVGVDLGVWKSTDSGTTWTHMGPASGMPNVAVFELKANHTTDRLVAFTHGRGAFATLLSSSSGGLNGADLSIGMKAAPNPVVFGSNLTYTINVTNNGPLVATNAVVTQSLPNGAAFISATSSQGTCTQAGGTMACKLGNLSGGLSATIIVTVKPAALGTIYSTATASSDTSDSNPFNNAVTVATLVSPITADLAISVVDSPDPVLVGGFLTYTLSVANNGPSTATGVFATNILPPSVSFVSAVLSQGSFANTSGTIICNFGTLASGSSATATLTVVPNTSGIITNTARVINTNTNQVDPISGNNSTIVTTTVSPSADLAVTIVDSPNHVLVRSNFTYLVTVANHGPSDATGVVLNDALPGNIIIVTNFVSQGAVSFANGVMTCNFGTLASGATATLTVVATAPNTAATLVSTATVSANQIDPNSANNSFTVRTIVSLPVVIIVPAGAMLTSENIVTNGAIDPGETVTIKFGLQNSGNIPTTNLVATLLTTGGVSSPSGPQSYGVLLPGGFPASTNFTFTATGTNGGVIVATLQLMDGTKNLGTVSFSFGLPNITTFSNPGFITIPDSGSASPYPSTIFVSGVTGLISKVSVTLSNMNHTFPDDIDTLLVHPTGRKTILMSDAGGPNALVNTTVTFDQTASAPVPDEGQIVSTSYRPADYESGDSFINAPVGPYSASLTPFNGSDPNGTWSLYVVDDTEGDSGNIADGWSLSLTTISPVNQIADLSVSSSASPAPVLAGDNLVYTFTVNNAGPNPASNVALTNVLPSGVDFISITNSQGNILFSGAVNICNLGSLAVGSSATVVLTVSPRAAGTVNSTVTVGASEVDLNLSNNSATLASSVNLPVADLSVTLSCLPATGIIGSNLTYSITVTNQGPNNALNVIVTDPLPAGTGFVSANSSFGNPIYASGTVTCNLGSLASGSGATISIIVTANSVGSFTNTVTASTASNDGDVSNNSATTVTVVSYPAPIIVAAGSRLTSESFSPPNATIDSGETVTLAFTLANVGSASTTNLSAHLLTSGGVTSVVGGTQSYGSLNPGGSASRKFIFTAAGPNDGTIIVTLALTDGGNSLGNVTFNFSLPNTVSFTNSGAITIPESGPATPYPSSINVSGLSGLVGKATVRLNQINHGFPDDIDIMLVGPGGQKLTLISDAGGAHRLQNVTLTFDDNAASALPDSDQIVSGTFIPTDYEPGDSFPGLFGEHPDTVLALYNGSDPNGVWSLYVVDDTPGDAGNIAGGWSLTLTTVHPVNPAADLSLEMLAREAMYVENYLVCNLNVVNHGPDAATNVILSATLPTGANLISVSSSQGSYNNASGKVNWSLGNIDAGASALATIVLQPTLLGIMQTSASVTSDAIDLFPNDNASVISTTVLDPAGVSLTASYINTNGTLRIILLGQPGQDYAIQSSTNLTSWISVSTNTAAGNGTVIYTEASITNPTRKFYRAIRLPQITPVPRD